MLLIYVFLQMFYTLKFTQCKIEYTMKDVPLIKHLDLNVTKKLFRQDKPKRMRMPTFSIIAAVDEVRTSKLHLVTISLSTSQLSILGQPLDTCVASKIH